MEKDEMTTAADLRALVGKVDKKKPTAADVTALRDFLHAHPTVWRITGDLAEQANLSMIEEMPAPTAMKESLKFGLPAMAAELTQPGDGELERLIIRQIVGCWLRLAYVEYIYSRNTVSGMNMRQGDHWERRLSAAQRRYLRAVESLARVRRLRLPAVQVNIAEQQVNQITRG